MSLTRALCPEAPDVAKRSLVFLGTLLWHFWVGDEQSWEREYLHTHRLTVREEPIAVSHAPHPQGFAHHARQPFGDFFDSSDCRWKEKKSLSQGHRPPRDLSAAADKPGVRTTPELILRFPVPPLHVAKLHSLNMSQQSYIAANNDFKDSGISL